ncbi:MAG: VIT1/CCC1 transporter family protein [Chloroflexota bacterium]
MTTSKDISRYRGNWQKEIDGAFLYKTLATSEEQPQIAEVYRRLSASEEKHAAAWEARMKEAGASIPPRRPTWRARILGLLSKRFGPSFVLPTITSNEQADSNAYDNQPEGETSRMAADEKSHARLLTAVGTKGGVSGGMVAQMEGRHRAGGGNALRAAVLGSNDGLVSILSLVMGVAGANLSNHDVFIAGIAGLLAGAGSMALGEWLSVQSSRELYANQIKIEKEELENNPAEEQEELSLIYQAKGLSESRARELSAAIMKTDQSSILDTLSREELGIDPDELGGSAYVAAFTSFFLFALGALFPLLPFAFLSGTIAVYVSMAVSAFALFIVGAAITLMTGRNIFYSGSRQVIIGLTAAIITFGVGKLIGVSIAG